jgi:hypothetical protein
VSEWWSYGLSDFLMFSPPVYWRLVARYNGAWWPAQWLALAAAAALLPLLLRPGGVTRTRATLLLLAAAWAWVGAAFFWQRYAEIFLGAQWAAAACGLQSLLLLAAACAPRRTAARADPPADPAQPAALRAVALLLLMAALLYPLLAPATGHAWHEAEVFGFMPDPTALATLAAAAALQRWPVWSRGGLAVIPLLVLLLGAATRALIAQ